MEQSSITTRAKAQKLNYLNESATKSRDTSKQPVRGKKSANIKDDLEATVGQSARKKSVNVKVTIGKSKKKRASSRRHNMVKEAKSENEGAVDKDESTSSNQSKEVSKDKHSGNVSTTYPIQPTDNDFSQWTNLEDLNKTPRKQKIIVPSIQEQSGMITPKSTPIKLNLTPHRSTKTPKKSPISLSSPKTHSVSISRLLKTPRKLSLTPGENLYLNNDSGNKKLKAKRDSSRDVSVSNESSRASSVVKNKRSKLKGIAHRFSKSPKIVLRSPSKKSKSPKLNISTRRKSRPSKKSLAGNVADTLPSLGGAKSSGASAKSTPPGSKNLSADKRWLLNSTLAKLLTASQMRDVLAEPIVLLKKLSLESKPGIFTTAAGCSDQSNHSSNIESGTPAESDASAYLRGSSRRSSSTAKTTNRSAGKLSPTRGDNKTPLMSSTPQEEATPLTRVNLMPDTSIVSVAQDYTAYPNTRSKYTNQIGMHATPSLSPMDKSATIEDVSKPSLLDVDIGDASQAHLANAAKQDTTYEVDQATELKRDQNNRKDATYELKDPQTPGLRQMIRKRTATDANLSAKENAKKCCRVRFANVKPDENGAHNTIGKSIGNRQSGVTRNSASIQRNITIMNSAHKSKRIEILRFNRDSLASPLNAKSSRVTPRGRLHNLNAASLDLDKFQATPKGLELAEKKSEKRSSVKKVPNFRRIHEKMFAKSESVVDARTRLESRHLEFATKKVLSEKLDVKKGTKLLPSDTTNGTYNRFGFKLRKAEATHVILKKQTVFSRQKQQHETRTVLKSVRTNRRFELQMKARNINPK